MPSKLEIVAIPVLTDNYAWLVHEPESGETMVVDPSVAEPVLAEAYARGWTITQVWNTHWHPDHTGGNEDIKLATGCTVTAPAAEATKIPTMDQAVREGDRIKLGPVQAVVIEVPCHTAGHVAYYLPDDDVVFSGDTLFAMGCGRLFEGTAEQMYSNMKRLEALPPETKVYCGHEYTLSNARFALTVEPDNEQLQQRYAEVQRARAASEVTLPSTIGLERATNPFMRAGSLEEFAERRHGKDIFQG